jgi:hypothetical protein
MKHCILIASTGGKPKRVSSFSQPVVPPKRNIHSFSGPPEVVLHSGGTLILDRHQLILLNCVRGAHNQYRSILLRKYLGTRNLMSL